MRTLLFLLVFAFSHNITAQVTTSSTVRVTGNVYNKQTGQKLTEKETNNLIEQYPGIVFEHVYNKYGTLVKLLFDPNKIDTGRAMYRSEENQIKPGEPFSEFVFKTVDGERISSEKLHGSWILLRFELFTKMMNEEEIALREEQIDRFCLSDKMTAIICFADTKTNVIQAFKSKKMNSKLISDGRNFQERYNIIKFPTTILIGKDGVVYKYYFASDKIDFNELK